MEKEQGLNLYIGKKTKHLFLSSKPMQGLLEGMMRGQYLSKHKFKPTIGSRCGTNV